VTRRLTQGKPGGGTSSNKHGRKKVDRRKIHQPSTKSESTKVRKLYKHHTRQKWEKKSGEKEKNKQNGLTGMAGKRGVERGRTPIEKTHSLGRPAKNHRLHWSRLPLESNQKMARKRVLLPITLMHSPKKVGKKPMR